MKVAFYSVKGGSRCSTAAAAYAIVTAETGQMVALIDHGTDMPALLGMPQPASIQYMPIEVSENLWLCSASYAAINNLDRFAVIVHDYGVVTEAPEADTRYLVTLPCYLSLRRGVGLNIKADAIILMTEPDRALDARDVERCYGIPVAAELPFDPMVARCIDAGLISSRLPRSLRAVVVDPVSITADSE